MPLREIISKTKFAEYGMKEPHPLNKPTESKKTTNSITITRRTDRSLLTLIVQTILRPLGPILTKPGKPTEPGSQPLTAPKKAHQRCHIVERKVQDVYMYDVTQRSPPLSSTPGPDIRNEKSEPQQKRMYYFCGGGWCMKPSGDHWKLMTALVASTPNLAMTLISYPLAPNSPAPETFPMLQTLLGQLMRDSQEANERVIIGGDSAGGNLALSLPIAALMAETEDAPALMPSAIFVMCPSVDLRRKNPAIRKLEPRDPLLRRAFITGTASAWCAGWDAQDPRMSPLLAPGRVFPALAERGVQVHGITASSDILSPDAVLFREKCAEAGVEGKWLDWEKQMHCFPLTWSYGLREGKEGKEWMARVLQEC